MTDLESAVEAGVLAMQEALYRQGVELVHELTRASAAAGQAGLATLNQLTTIGEWYSLGMIDAPSAKIASENYIEVIHLLARTVVTEAASEAYKRGIALLNTFMTVGLAVLEIALQVALPNVGAILHAVVAKVTEEVMKP